MVLVRLAKSRRGSGQTSTRCTTTSRPPVGDLPPHQLLAINRGETEGVLKVSLDTPDDLIVGPDRAPGGVEPALSLCARTCARPWRMATAG